MKQRYALITFFLVLVVYHITRGCPTCMLRSQLAHIVPKNEIYAPLNNLSISNKTVDHAFTGA